MTQNNNNSPNYAIGPAGALGVAFVVLKLLGKIDWSWWWVTAPFWAPLAFVLTALVLVIAVTFVAKLLKWLL